MNFINVLKKVYSKDSLNFLILSGVILLFIILFIQDSFLSKLIMFVSLSIGGGIVGYFYKKNDSDDIHVLSSGYKKGASTALILVTFMTWVIGPSVDLKNRVSVMEHLQSHTFEYVDYSNNMTNFVEFSQNRCSIKVFLDGKKFSTNSYSYDLGNVDSKGEKINLNIMGNTGNWSLHDDGNIYMWNAGDVHIYYAKEL